MLVLLSECIVPEVLWPFLVVHFFVFVCAMPGLLRNDRSDPLSICQVCAGYFHAISGLSLFVQVASVTTCSLARLHF